MKRFSLFFIALCSFVCVFADEQEHEDYVVINRANGSSISIPIDDVLSIQIIRKLIEPDVPPTPVSFPIPTEVVDMGLPSGTLWAPFNMGASQVGQPGSLIGFGDITGQLVSNDPADYPTPPTQSIAGNSAYDVATALWGTDWQMPTAAQFQELFNSCEQLHVTSYNNTNIAGVLYVSLINGNELFFPYNYPRNCTLPVNTQKGSSLFWTADVSPNRLVTYILISGTQIYDSHNQPVSVGMSIRPVYVGNGAPSTNPVTPPVPSDPTNPDTPNPTDPTIPDNPDPIVPETSVADTEPVDLHLPSGNLWANYNLGASSSSPLGDYFRWGDTIPGTDADYYSPQNYFLTRRDTAYNSHKLSLSTDIISFVPDTIFNHSEDPATPDLVDTISFYVIDTTFTLVSDSVKNISAEIHVQLRHNLTTHLDSIFTCDTIFSLPEESKTVAIRNVALPFSIVFHKETENASPSFELKYQCIDRYDTIVTIATGQYDFIGWWIHGTKYDAARHFWGGTWRLPSSDDFRELIEYCTVELETRGEIEGYRFTSKYNGNSIFFPFMGYRSGDQLFGTSNLMTRYWSSAMYNLSIGNHASKHDWIEVLSLKSVVLDDESLIAVPEVVQIYPHMGCPIRPVMNGTPNYDVY